MTTLLLTHAYCSDGFCSNWILNKVFPLAKSIYCQYGMDPPDVTDHDVVIADFSFHRDILLGMKRRARSLVVLDHHRTAEAELYGLDFCVFDMNRSGAGITWDYFFPTTPRPALINYVEDRDLWTRRLPNTDEIAAVIQATPFELSAWTDLADRMDMEFGDVVKEGAAILRCHARFEERIEAAKVDVVIDGHRVPAVNTPVLQSEMGNLLSRGVAFAVAWYVTTEGRVRFSLRSSEGGIDVSEIAAKFAGGGHISAAGFEVDLEQAMTMFAPRGLLPIRVDTA